MQLGVLLSSVNSICNQGWTVAGMKIFVYCDVAVNGSFTKEVTEYSSYLIGRAEMLWTLLFNKLAFILWFIVENEISHLHNRKENKQVSN